MALSGAATTQAMIGRQFGKLTPIMVGVETGFKGPRVLCICECGNEMVVRQGSLFASKRPVKSCIACAKKDNGIANRIHGLSKTRIYRIWNGMKQRCDDIKNKDFLRYGGRGITIYSEWYDVTKFAEWAYANGYDDTLTIDRKDSSGNYEPDNCRFITFSENSSLTRDTHWFEAFGEKKTIAQWIKDSRCTVASGTLYHRWKQLGWSMEDAISVPCGARKGGGRKRNG